MDPSGSAMRSGSRAPEEHGAEERLEAVPIRCRPQVAALVDDVRRQRGMRLTGIDRHEPVGARRGMPSTTSSFSSGSLEQVA